MKKIIGTIVAASATLIVGCATTAPSGDAFNVVEISPAKYEKKADTFVIIQDASSSMNDEHMGRSKIDLAKETLSHFNQTIPQLDFNAGLTAFGTGGCISEAEVLYGVEKYSNNGLASGIDKITCASGTTPMSSGINRADSLLTEPGSGRIAVFIVSDGITDAEHHSDATRRAGAIAAAKQLKNRYGTNVCIYPIQIGDEPDSKKFMDELATIGSCGFVTNHTEISSAKTMDSYVIKTLLKPRVAAYVAPPPVATIPEKIIFSADTLFSFDKAVLKPEGRQSLDKLISRMKNVKHGGISVVGYTDRLGPEDYNEQLSVLRANTVKNYLIARGIDAGNIFVKGRGEENSITGITCAGMSKNLIACLQPDRRVEIEFTGV